MALNLRLNMRPTFGTKLTFVLTPAYFYFKLFYKDIPHYFLVLFAIRGYEHHVVVYFY